MGGQNRLVIDIIPRKNSKPICSDCGKRGTVYDHQQRGRYFEFIPIWGITVFFWYVMRRVNCKACGVKVESVPWCEGKHQLTTTYRLFLAHWAKRLSWKEVAEAFYTSWENVYRSVCYVVEYGLKNRVLSDVEAIGVDEIQFGKGHQYLTVVYQLNSDNKRLLFVGRHRTVKTLLKLFREFGKDNLENIKYVCSEYGSLT